MLPRSVLISPLCAMQPVGVRAVPGRERVGAEALVHERQRRLVVGSRRSGNIVRICCGHQHALVDDACGAERLDDVELTRWSRASASSARGAGLRITYELALERVASSVGAAAGGRGTPAQRAALARALSRPPSADRRSGTSRQPRTRLAFLCTCADLRRSCSALLARRPRGGVKTMPSPRSGAGSPAASMPTARGPRARNLCGQLEQDARAVAGVRARSRTAPRCSRLTRTAMAFLHDVVRPLALGCARRSRRRRRRDPPEDRKNPGEPPVRQLATVSGQPAQRRLPIVDSSRLRTDRSWSGYCQRGREHIENTMICGNPSQNEMV